ncbi:hypothetical protein [Trinickia sp.]|uniref:hypothetical protein n=1 Tax=Trinickia sp. TaxID=2571163 RepID=UPI003F7E3AED
MNDNQLVFFYLQRLEAAGGNPKPALLAKVSEPSITVRCIGAKGARIYETAVANIFFQSNGEAATIFMIGVPTEWELGLMIANKIQEVYYLDDGGAIQRIDLSDTLKSGIFPPPVSAGPLGAVPADARNDALDGWKAAFVAARPVKQLHDAATKKFENFAKSVKEYGPKIRRADPLDTSALPFYEGVPTVAGNRNSVTHRDAILMKLAFALVGETWSSTTAPRMRGDRLPIGNNIGAILTDASSNIIAWSVNVAGGDNGPTCHAECALVRAVIQKEGAVPSGYRLYTSLEPCYMCGGILSTFCSKWSIFYGQSDATIKNNALRRSGRQTQVRATSAMAIEALYTTGKSGGPWGAGETLKFLRDEDSRKAFKKLALVPDRLLQGFTDLTIRTNVPVHAASNNRMGQLMAHVDLSQAQLSTIATPVQSRSRVAALDLAVPRVAPPGTLPWQVAPPARRTYVTTGAGVSEELALVDSCVTLLKNLTARSLIALPPPS